jgi:hypothetical protein
MCGAGVCRDHAVIATRHLTKPAAVMREIPVEPATRIIRCTMCHAAADAAAGHSARPERR